MADWEFDGSVDFAPPHYRKKKYEEAENFIIKDEETAKQYIELMDYIHYLHGDDEYWVAQGHSTHNIDNFDEMVKKETEAWNFITDEEFIYRKIIYPQNQKLWRSGFDYLRSLEPSVIKGKISKKQYSIMIQNFNSIIEELNKQTNKYNLIGHTFYWIQSTPLKVDMRKYGIK